jgi:hypothetical protein|tara:strand:+ start:763 stop:1575 length:813 start_codon:yes stop_codon:yes gene_type:complete
MADKIWTGATSGDYGVSTNWSPSGVPIAADSVYFTADYNVNVTGSLDQSSIALDKFVVDGYTGKIGTLALGYLQIDPDSFSFSGSDVCFIDVGAAAIDLDVRGTGGGGSTRGLYVKGSAIAVLSLINGNLGLANQYGETSTAATIRVTGGTMHCGTGSTLTTVDVYGGTINLGASVTTLNAFSGTVNTSSAAAITTLNGYGGTITHNGTGTITTANLDGAELDLTDSGLARTVTTLNLDAGGIIKYDPSVVTITTQNEASVPVRISANNA